MTEGTSLNQEEIRQLNRDLMEKITARATPSGSRGSWADPGAAIMEVGFPEAQQLQELQASAGILQAEVQGQQHHLSDSETIRCVIPGFTLYL